MLRKRKRLEDKVIELTIQYNELFKTHMLKICHPMHESDMAVSVWSPIIYMMSVRIKRALIHFTKNDLIKTYYYQYCILEHNDVILPSEDWWCMILCKYMNPISITYPKKLNNVEVMPRSNLTCPNFEKWHNMSRYFIVAH